MIAALLSAFTEAKIVQECFQADAAIYLDSLKQFF